MSLKVFISGATGFVGCHLMDLLSSPEYEICGTSFPGKPEEEDCYRGKNISYLDIRSEQEVFETIKRAQPDWIFHLAAISNVRHSWEQRRETLETNLMGSFYLFEAVRKLVPKARFLLVSSSDVYGILVPIEKALKER